jgi:protein-tyrosine phosphatase
LAQSGWSQDAGPNPNPARHNPSIGGFIDIHAHVLPGIDDGPEELEQSLAMARAAADSGTSTIAATPHLHPNFPGVHVHEIAARCEALNQAVASERIPLEVVPAAEVSLAWALEATDEQLRLASYGQRGTDLLIETPFTQVIGLDRFLYQLRAQGYRITLGHPERNPEFQRDDGPLRALVDQGVLLQLNSESLLGSPRRGAHRLARGLLTAGLVHAIASDGHRASSWRPVTRLADAAEAVAAMVGQAQATWLAVHSPAAIMDGKDLPPPPPMTRQSTARRRLFGLKSPFKA